MSPFGGLLNINLIKSQPEDIIISYEFSVPHKMLKLFCALIFRCGIRANHKISYEQFLEKFQMPVTKGNGQTIPIKPSHKYVDQLSY